MQILIVEDDDAIAEPLLEGLTRHGFTAIHVATGKQAIEADQFDLVLLDLGLPDMDGNDVVRELRAKSNTPIIIISARDDESDRVLGLELGADDYITKPFGIREVIARIRAVNRRAASSRDTNFLRAADVELDIRTRAAKRGEKSLDLTAKEFDLLMCLADDPGAVVSREDIIETVWDTTWYGSTKTLDVHIASLRKKLGEPDLIETVRGVGYRLRTEQ